MKKFIYIILAAVALLPTACREDFKELDKGHTPLAISADKDTLSLDQTEYSSNGLTLSWTSGTNNGTGHRICSTVFDYDNAPYSNMVLGEVFNKPGKWSSYPPHHHPQPEVYYYRFDKPQGFGACFNGEDVFKTKDGSVCFITSGNDHQQAAAPGYEMYYVWMIRHLDGDPWYKTTRFYAKEHEWLTKAP